MGTCATKRRATNRQIGLEAINSHFENFESALYMKSVSKPVTPTWKQTNKQINKQTTHTHTPPPTPKHTHTHTKHKTFKYKY